MVALPLFKLASLFVRHISKYGANHIKIQAHEHPRFRAIAATCGQSMHQINMRLNVSLLRNPDAEKRAREKAELAEAPTVKTKEQVDREAREKAKEEADRAKYGTTAKESHRTTTAGTRMSVWRRKFRPLPEAKAVDLFADVLGDSFILVVGGVLILYEYYRSAGKPDANAERYKQLSEQITAIRAEELRQSSRILAMESALRNYRDPKTKQPLLPPAPPEEVEVPQTAATTEPIQSAQNEVKSAPETGPTPISVVVKV